MLIRTYPKGSVLEDYLHRYLEELLSLYIKMTAIGETLRSAIQRNEELTQLDLIEFFQQRIANPDSLFYFFQICGQKGE